MMNSSIHPQTNSLTPREGTDTFGRDGFYWHGNNTRNDASRGCPINDYDVRNRINNSGDNLLRVVP